jgi:predicted transposase YbfD/YdcC
MKSLQIEIPELLDHLAEAEQLEGALVTSDATGCQVVIADKIVEHKADYLLALKGNQPTLEAEVSDYFNSGPAEELVVKTRKLKRGTAASRCEPTPLHRMSTGSSPPGVTPVSRASPT